MLNKLVGVGITESVKYEQILEMDEVVSNANI